MEAATAIKGKQGRNWGGVRVGAGRPKAEGATYAKWKFIEQRIRAVSREVLTREKLLEIARSDPQRFIERVILPLMESEARLKLGGMRLGVNVQDGSKSTQFVLDFGGVDPSEAQEVGAGAALEALEHFGDERAP